MTVEEDESTSESKSKADDTPMKKKTKSKTSKKTKKSTEPIGKTKIRKQASAITTLLKKGRLFEIRKILRRVEVIRKKKGNEAQLQKNERKASRLLQEVSAMRDFLMEPLTLRTIDILCGKADKGDVELYDAACEGKQQLEALLQKLSIEASTKEEDAESIFSRIAFLRILSCPDVLPKLKLIREGVNVNPKKNKMKRKKSKSKQEKNAKRKHTLSEEKDKKDENSDKLSEDDEDAQSEEEINAQDNTTLTSKTKKSSKEGIPTESKPNEPKQNNKRERIKKEKLTESKSPAAKKDMPAEDKDDKLFSFSGDSFFLSSLNTIDNEDMSTDDEFSAPVTKERKRNKSIIRKRKSDDDGDNDDEDFIDVKPKQNRKGQRARRKLAEQKYGKDTILKYADSIKNQVKKKQNLERQKQQKQRKPVVEFPSSKTFVKKKETATEKKIDETLHPSWIAKQKAKAALAKTEFTGTKITFDDD